MLTQVRKFFQANLLRHTPAPFLTNCSVARSLIGVNGRDAERLLQSLVTNDVTRLDVGEAMFAAFLSPQGKVLIDAIIIRRSSDEFLLDHDRAVQPSLLNHLRRYKLRAKANLVPEELVQAQSWAVWGHNPPSSPPAQSSSETDGELSLVAQVSTGTGADEAMVFSDPRTPLLGHRAVVWRRSANQQLAGVTGEPIESGDSRFGSVDPGFAQVECAPDGQLLAPYGAYRHFQMCMGVPSGPDDLPYDTAFPGEATLDFLNGVCYTKGCYLGQEQTARTHHRGTVRKMLLPLVALPDRHQSNGNASGSEDPPHVYDWSPFPPGHFADKREVVRLLYSVAETWTVGATVPRGSHLSLDSDKPSQDGQASRRRRRRPPAEVIATFGNLALANVRLECLVNPDIHRTVLKSDTGARFSVLPPHWWNTYLETPSDQ